MKDADTPMHCHAGTGHFPVIAAGTVWRNSISFILNALRLRRFSGGSQVLLPERSADMPDFRGVFLPVPDFHNIVTEGHRFRKLAKPFRRPLAYQRSFAGIHGTPGSPITITRTGFHLHKNEAVPVPANNVQLTAPHRAPISP